MKNKVGWIETGALFIEQWFSFLTANASDLPLTRSSNSEADLQD